MSTDEQPVVSHGRVGEVTLTTGEFAVDTDGIVRPDPAGPHGINRPDGQLGYTERLANAHVVDDDPPAPLRQRPGDQPLPTAGVGGPIHELVMADVANRMAVGITRYGRPLRAFDGRDTHRDLYEELLDAACYVRKLMEEERIRQERVGSAPAGEPFPADPSVTDLDPSTPG